MKKKDTSSKECECKDCSKCGEKHEELWEPRTEIAVLGCSNCGSDTLKVFLPLDEPALSLVVSCGNCGGFIAEFFIHEIPEYLGNPKGSIVEGNA